MSTAPPLENEGELAIQSEPETNISSDGSADRFTNDRKIPQKSEFNPWLTNDIATIYAKFYTHPVSNYNLFDTHSADSARLGNILLSTVHTQCFEDYLTIVKLQNGERVDSGDAKPKKIEEKPPVTDDVGGMAPATSETHATMMLISEPSLNLGTETPRSPTTVVPRDVNEVKQITMNVLNYPTSIVLRIPESTFLEFSEKPATVEGESAIYAMLLNMVAKSIVQKRLTGDDAKTDASKLKLYDALNEGVDLATVDVDYFIRKLKVIDVRWKPVISESASMYGGHTAWELFEDFFNNLEKSVRDEWRRATEGSILSPKPPSDGANPQQRQRVSATVCYSDGSVAVCEKVEGVGSVHDRVVETQLLNQSLNTNDDAQIRTISDCLSGIVSQISSDIDDLCEYNPCISYEKNGKTSYAIVVSENESAFLKAVNGYPKMVYCDVLFGDILGKKIKTADQGVENRTSRKMVVVDATMFFWYITNRRFFDVRVHSDGKWIQSKMNLKQYCANVIALTISPDVLSKLGGESLNDRSNTYYESCLVARLYKEFAKMFNNRCKGSLSSVSKRAVTVTVTVKYSVILKKLKKRVKNPKFDAQLPDRKARLVSALDKMHWVALKMEKKMKKAKNATAQESNAANALRMMINGTIDRVMKYIAKQRRGVADPPSLPLFEQSGNTEQNEKRRVARTAYFNVMNKWFENVSNHAEEDAEASVLSKNTIKTETSRSVVSLLLEIKNEKRTKACVSEAFAKLNETKSVKVPANIRSASEVKTERRINDEDVVVPVYGGKTSTCSEEDRNRSNAFPLATKPSLFMWDNDVTF